MGEAYLIACDAVKKNLELCPRNLGIHTGEVQQEVVG